MDWTTLATGIAFIIVCLLLWVFMPKAKVFYELPMDLNLENFSEEKCKDIVKQVNLIDDKTGFVPIYYDRTGFINEKYQSILDLINMPYQIQAVALIRIPARFNQKKQWGIAEYSNKVLRCLICLQQPAAKKAGIWVDGEKRFLSTGSAILYDPTRENSLFNIFGYESAVVLMVDIERCGLGSSPNEHDWQKDEIAAVFEDVFDNTDDESDGYSLMG